MKRLALIITAAAMLAGCGLAREAEQRALAEQRAAVLKQETDAAEADYAAKKITFGQMVARASDARIAAFPGDALAAEEAYFAKLQGARVDKGEITIDEYRYSVARASSDVSGRRQTRAAQAATAAAAVRASRPRSVYCTSNKVGDFTYTNCN